MNNSHWLLERFESFKQKTAIVCKDEEISFMDLVERIKFWLVLLQENNIQPGDRVSL